MVFPRLSDLGVTRKTEETYGRRIAQKDMLQAGVEILGFNVFPITNNKKENNNDWN